MTGIYGRAPTFLLRMSCAQGVGAHQGNRELTSRMGQRKGKNCRGREVTRDLERNPSQLQLLTIPPICYLPVLASVPLLQPPPKAQNCHGVKGSYEQKVPMARGSGGGAHSHTLLGTH